MELLVDIGISLVVIMIMLVVGLQLTLEDFRRIRLCPTPLLVATAGQLIALPVIAAGLAWAFEPAPHSVAGMVRVAACPGLDQHCRAFGHRPASYRDGVPAHAGVTGLLASH